MDRNLKRRVDTIVHAAVHGIPFEVAGIIETLLREVTFNRECYHEVFLYRREFLFVWVVIFACYVVDGRIMSFKEMDEFLGTVDETHVVGENRE